MSQPLKFIGIGAQKAGTTWLFSRLNELSEFALPYEKEIHYFDRDPKYPSPAFLSESSVWKRLPDLNRTKHGVKLVAKFLREKDIKKAAWYEKWYFGNYRDEWYLDLFRSMEGISGEITPSYSILDLEDVKRMHKLLPELKLIFLMRNPIERAWSQYRFDLKLKNIQVDDLNQIDIEKALDFFKSEGQDQRSNYLKTLQVYSAVFPAEQILVGFYDAISDQPRELLHKIVTFIGGSPNAIDTECKLESRSNVSPNLQMPMEVENYLNERYLPMMEKLAHLFGGYASNWLGKEAGELAPCFCLSDKKLESRDFELTHSED